MKQPVSPKHSNGRSSSLNIRIGVTSARGIITTSTVASIYSLVNALQLRGVPCSCQCVDGPDLTKNLNEIATHVVKDTSISHLLLVDDEIGFHVSMVEQLIAAKTYIACAHVSDKKLEIRDLFEVASSIGKASPDKAATGDDQHSTEDVESAALNFALIDARVFDRLLALGKVPRYIVDNDDDDGPFRKPPVMTFGFFSAASEASGHEVRIGYDAFCWRWVAQCGGSAIKVCRGLNVPFSATILNKTRFIDAFQGC